MSNQNKLNKEELYTYFENNFKPNDLTDVFGCSSSYISKYYTEWRKTKGITQFAEKEEREAKAFQYFSEGLSRYEAAEKLGVHTASIYRYFKTWATKYPEQAIKYHQLLEDDITSRKGKVGKPIAATTTMANPNDILKKRKKALELLRQGKSPAEVKKTLSLTCSEAERYTSAYRKEIGSPVFVSPESQKRKKQAFQLLDQGKHGAAIARELGISCSRVSHFSQEYAELKQLGELQAYYDSVSDLQEDICPTKVLPNQLDIMTEPPTEDIVPPITMPPKGSEEEVVDVAIVINTPDTQVTPEPILELTDETPVVVATLEPEPLKKRKGFKVRQIDGEYASYQFEDRHIILTVEGQQMTLSQLELQSLVEELPDVLKFLLT